MAYIGKTNWTNNEIVEAADMNRIEQGVTDNDTGLINHKNNTSNPHQTTKTQVGLGKVDNTADANKEVLSATKLKTARTIQGKSFDGTANITLDNATTGAAGLMSAADKSKLNGIAANANNYTHPASHPASMITDLPTGKKVARFVIGISTAGWTAADCDYLCGGTNDQEEIIQALNDLPATGGEVVILDGTYNITASINIPKDNVSLRGNGNATILKRMYNSTDTDSGSTAKGLINLNGKSGCKIQGLQIDGNKAAYTEIYNDGIRLSLSSNNTVIGNTCNNNDYGIRLSLSSNNTVIGNICNNNYNYGIHLYSSSSGNMVTGNICNNNNDDGIHLYSSSSNTVIGNTCNNNDGIRLSSSSNNTVIGNICNNTYNYGIHLSSSSNNTVIGNTCIRGTGTPEDYAIDQYTIFLSGTGNDYNLISSNNCMGKAVVISGGTGNSAWGNKFDDTDDLP